MGPSRQLTSIAGLQRQCRTPETSRWGTLWTTSGLLVIPSLLDRIILGALHVLSEKTLCD
jgi:hypothetical protein